MQPLAKDRTVVETVSDTDNPSLLQVLQSRKLLLLSALLFVATLLLYGPVENHKFINFDDNLYVTGNSHVLSGLSLKNVEWAFGSLETGNWHPLDWLSHMLDVQLFRLNPAGHHYTNVLLHGANVFLLFFLLYKATGAVWRSFFVAALFAVHPLNVESVAWVAERKTLLCAFFCFLTFAAYGWYAKAVSWFRYLVVLGVFILALMSKAMAVTMPVALLLVDYWPLNRLATVGLTGPLTLRNRLAAHLKPATKLFVEKLPFFFLSAVGSYVAIIAQHSEGALNTYTPLSIRLKNAIVSYVAYIQKAGWPSNLSVFYPHPEASTLWSKVILSLVVLVAVSAVALGLYRKRYIAVSWAFFLVTLLPVIGIVQVGGQAMADRYAYTPLIGIFVLAVWGIADSCEHLRIKPVIPAIAAVCVLSALAVSTRSTLQYWNDSLTLFTHAESVTAPPNKVIEINLGEAYDDAGLTDEAVRHYQIARELDPNNALGLYNLGDYLLRNGRAGESVELFQGAIRYASTPQLAVYSRHNLGTAYLMTGKYSLAENAFTSALQIDTNSSASLAGRGQAFYNEGKFEEAVSDFSQALKIAPNAQVFFLQGKALEAQHKFQQALAAYSTALKGLPDSPEVQERFAALQKNIAGANLPK